jgi:predicted dienelactone hydrolase
MLVASSLLRAEPYKEAAGPHKVETLNADWTDAARQRTLPVKIYYPTDLEAPAPVILFSHGLGGSREVGAYLGRHWASHGYVCVFLQHPGSDTSAWQGKRNPVEALRQTLRDPSHFVDRPKDVQFAVDQIERFAKQDPQFRGKLDPRRIGLGGHSFGADTTQVAAGMGAGALAGREVSLAEPRIKAAVLMSPTAVRGVSDANRDKVYAKVSIPILHLTGTKDESPINDTRAEERRIPFDHIRASGQYLIIFDGGDHMVFSGRPRTGLGFLQSRGDTSKDSAIHSVILQSTTAFWDAYLLEKADARKWLDGNGLKESVGNLGAMEKK